MEEHSKQLTLLHNLKESCPEFFYFVLLPYSAQYIELCLHITNSYCLLQCCLTNRLLWKINKKVKHTFFSSKYLPMYSQMHRQKKYTQSIFTSCHRQSEPDAWKLVHSCHLTPYSLLLQTHYSSVCICRNSETFSETIHLAIASVISCIKCTASLLIGKWGTENPRSSLIWTSSVALKCK